MSQEKRAEGYLTELGEKGKKPFRGSKKREKGVHNTLGKKGMGEKGERTSVEWDRRRHGTCCIDSAEDPVTVKTFPLREKKGRV